MVTEILTGTAMNLWTTLGEFWYLNNIKCLNALAQTPVGFVFPFLVFYTSQCTSLPWMITEYFVLPDVIVNGIFLFQCVCKYKCLLCVDLTPCICLDFFF
jgi:hypothetical protein